MCFKGSGAPSTSTSSKGGSSNLAAEAMARASADASKSDDALGSVRPQSRNKARTLGYTGKSTSGLVRRTLLSVTSPFFRG